MPPDPFGVIADRLSDSWTLKARPSQLPPPGDWLVWLVMAGRGFGKTRTGAEYVRMMVESGQARNVGLVAPTTADARQVMVDGPGSGLLRICPDWDVPVWEPTNRQVKWANGAIATTFSSEEPERLRGQQFDLVWADEVGAWRNQRETWDQIQFCLRLGRRIRTIVTTTPRPTPVIRELVKRAKDPHDVVITRGSTAENAANLAPSFVEDITRRYAGTRIGRQELDAELLEDTPGALWTRDMLDETRWKEAQWPALSRIVVALDPSMTSGEEADEAGIIAAGLDHAGHGYVLRDESGRMGPTEWARKAVALYHHLHADRLVYEANQGGDTVEATIRAVDPNVALRRIHASKGKIARAEPVSAFFEQGRAHLCGAFPQLEDQLTTYAPGMAKSPDRLDAMVYALLELMGGGGNFDGFIEYARRMAEETAAPKMLKDERTFRCYAPHPGAVFTMTGRRVDVGMDLIADLTRDEARPLRAAPGWTIPMEVSDG